MEFGAIIVILTIAIMIFFSFNMISVYNRIIMLQSSLIKKFEPIDLSIKKYIDILNELIKIVSDEKDSEELLILAKKLSRVSDNEKKLLVLKDADYTINRFFDIYKNKKKIKELKEEYERYSNKILYATDIYNRKVREYNKLLDEFPYIIITKLFSIKKIKTIDGE